MCDEASEIQTEVCVSAEPQRRRRKNKEELVTLLTEESLMGLLVNLRSVCHSLAYRDRRFGGGREEMNLFREHDICGLQR